MRTIISIFILLFLFGCVQPAPATPTVETPTTPIEITPPVLVEEEPIPTDVDVIILAGEKGPLFENVNENFDDVNSECAFGACTLTFAYYPELNEGQTLHFSSPDYNFLNDSSVFVSEPQYVILALTTDPVMKNGIFSYAKNDHPYVSNYWATFKKVNNALPKLEEYTGLELEDNYALVWNSQYSTAGEYVGSNIIFLSQENPYLLSATMMHELTHSLTDGMNLPTWMNEGVAEYYAYTTLDIFHPKSGYKEGLEKWGNPIASEEFDLTEFHQEFYDPSHTLVQNFAEKYGEENLRALVDYFLEHPLKRPSTMKAFEDNNEIILGKMRELSEDEKLVSVEYLADAHLKK